MRSLPEVSPDAAEKRTPIEPEPGFLSRPCSTPSPGLFTSTLRQSLVARMRGPGGYYNIGNVLALTAAIVVQVVVVMRVGATDLNAVAAAVQATLFGSLGATALTVAIAIFFVGGEFYHRAWADGGPPVQRLNWWGDFLSGFAALVLTAALALFGDLLLAATSGILLAGGKFGSALVPEDHASPDPSNKWPGRFRKAVLASRVPALIAMGAALIGALTSDMTERPLAEVVMPAVMVVCYLLWARADLLLFASPKADKTGTADTASLRNGEQGE